MKKTSIILALIFTLFFFLGCTQPLQPSTQNGSLQIMFSNPNKFNQYASQGLIEVLGVDGLKVAEKRVNNYTSPIVIDNIPPGEYMLAKPIGLCSIVSSTNCNDNNLSACTIPIAELFSISKGKVTTISIVCIPTDIE